MQNIGDRLEEARKRQGISIREAAEATKIRSDFLLNFERGQFDFDLPEVYKRGFLKLYARYLKLDAEKVITDYQSLILGATKHAKRERGEFFGRMDLPDPFSSFGGKREAEDEEEAPPEPTEKKPKAKKEKKTRFAGTVAEGGPADAMEQETDSSIYWKIGLVFLGTIATVVLIFFLGKILFTGGGDVEPVAEGGSETVRTEQPVETPQNIAEQADSYSGTFTIRALNDTKLLVRQDINREQLFRGDLYRGQAETVDRTGVVRISTYNVENVEIQLNGRTVGAGGKSGPGRFIVYENRVEVEAAEGN